MAKLEPDCPPTSERLKRCHVKGASALLWTQDITGCVSQRPIKVSRMPQGYWHPFPGSLCFGNALLAPTHSSLTIMNNSRLLLVPSTRRSGEWKGGLPPCYRDMCTKKCTGIPVLPVATRADKSIHYARVRCGTCRHVDRSPATKRGASIIA